MSAGTQLSDFETSTDLRFSEHQTEFIALRHLFTIGVVAPHIIMNHAKIQSWRFLKVSTEIVLARTRWFYCMLAQGQTLLSSKPRPTNDLLRTHLISVHYTRESAKFSFFRSSDGCRPAPFTYLLF